MSTKKAVIPRIETFNETLLVGQKRSMSFTHSDTLGLWQSFMPRCHEIKNLMSPDLYAVEVYPDTAYFQHFDPARAFVKWAAVAVREADHMPEGMERLLIPEGSYAVFHYIGMASEGAAFYQYIYNEWLPASEWLLDDRPHFAVMGEKYSGDAHDSEEDIWIPVKKK